MWRARNGFTLLPLVIALCGAAAAQPSVTPAHRPMQPDSDEQRMADLVVASRILVQEGVLSVTQRLRDRTVHIDDAGPRPARAWCITEADRASACALRLADDCAAPGRRRSIGAGRAARPFVCLTLGDSPLSRRGRGC